MNKDCYLANLCIIMEALFEIDLGPACKKAKLDKPISQEDNKENNYGNKSKGQYFYNRSQVGVSEKYFDWKRNCFICGQVCDTKHRSGWSIRDFHKWLPSNKWRHCWGTEQTGTNDVTEYLAGNRLYRS